MVVLEIMDYDMLHIIEHGAHVPMYQPMVDNVHTGGLKQKLTTIYDVEEKIIISLDVKAISAIGNSLPYHIYHLVENYESTQEMMETLIVADEGTVEVQATTVNNLNRRYENFFAQSGETLTQTFNRFNFLVNDMHMLGITKH